MPKTFQKDKEKKEERKSRTNVLEGTTGRGYLMFGSETFLRPREWPEAESSMKKRVRNNLEKVRAVGKNI